MFEENKSIDDMSEEELVKILDKGELTEEDFLELILAMQNKGMKGSLMEISDSDSEEGRAATEYIEYHKKLPKAYPDMPEEEVEKAKKVLFAENASLEDKKKALIVLAHVGRVDSYKALEKYEKNPDQELKIWINMAIQECQSFLKSDLMDKPIIEVTKVTKVGRNEPCPCGAKKQDGEPIKYKHCCGK